MRCTGSTVKLVSPKLNSVAHPRRKQGDWPGGPLLTTLQSRGCNLHFRGPIHHFPQFSRVAQRVVCNVFILPLVGTLGEKGSPRPRPVPSAPLATEQRSEPPGACGTPGWRHLPFQCQHIRLGFAASASSQCCLCQELLTVVPQPRLCSSSQSKRLCSFLFG